jgi:hypothetical protein
MGCPVSLARKGEVWLQSCLGQKSKMQGVYVLHHGGDIKYVGKTNGPSMSFGMRLRREFQETASGGKHVYPQLVKLAVPPPILVSLFPADEIENMVQLFGTKFDAHQKIEVFEAVLTHAYQPDFQRHHEKRTVAHIRKLGITSDPAALLRILKEQGSDKV